MSMPVDTKTNEPWPAVWANRMLQEIRTEAIDNLKARSVARGIPENGQCYTMETIGDEGDENATQVAVIDAVMVKNRHNYRDVRLLTNARWSRFCSTPQDLSAFITRFETPDEAALERVESAAADIEASLHEGAAPTVETATAAATVQLPPMEVLAVDEPLPKRGPGRPKGSGKTTAVA